MKKISIKWGDPVILSFNWQVDVTFKKGSQMILWRHLSHCPGLGFPWKYFVYGLCHSLTPMPLRREFTVCSLLGCKCFLLGIFSPGRKYLAERNKQSLSASWTGRRRPCARGHVQSLAGCAHGAGKAEAAPRSAVKESRGRKMRVHKQEVCLSGTSSWLFFFLFKKW